MSVTVSANPFTSPKHNRSAGETATEGVQPLSAQPASRLLGLDFEVGIAGARLSLGERQRVALARVLLRRPDVIVLDDVLGALDSTCRADILAILRDEAAAGVTVVAALGDPGHAEGFDRIITLENGRILQHGDGRRILRQEMGNSRHEPE